MSEVDLNREMAGIWMNLFRDVSRSAEQAASRVAALLEGEIEDSAPVIRSRWGRKILRLDALGIERGMTTKEISVAVGINEEPYAEKVWLVRPPTTRPPPRRRGATREARCSEGVPRPRKPREPPTGSSAG
jgi:hypothetical protein